MGLIRSVAETGFAQGQMRRTGWTELQTGVMWHGHIDDLARLVYCLAAHCTCGRPTLADGIWQCRAHQMLTDQHTLDHLAFARGMRQRILESEWVVFWEPDEQPEPRGIGRLDLLHRGQEERRLNKRGHREDRHGLRAVGYALAGLAVVLSLSGPLLAPSTATTRPVAAWQTR
jgi:hypothetical protein